MTALRAASYNGHDDVVRVLLAAKATVNAQDKVSQSIDILRGSGIRNAMERKLTIYVSFIPCVWLVTMS